MTQTDLEPIKARLEGAAHTLEHVSTVAADGQAGEVEYLVMTAAGFDETAKELRADAAALIAEVEALREWQAKAVSNLRICALHTQVEGRRLECDALIAQAQAGQGG